MSGLGVVEKSIFICVVLTYLAAGGVGFRQLSRDGEKYRRLLICLIAFAVSIESVMLIFRAVSLKAVPLTGLFESMIVLTIAFGLAFLFLSVVIREVLFSSVMSWFLVVMILLTAVLTKPAEVAHPVAKMPWAIAHGMAMALGGAMVVFATAVAFLYLLANRRLKQKKLSKVLGRLPNFQKLEMLNLFGLKAGFVLLTFGLMSGVGMMAFKGKMIQTDIAQWFLDPKIVLIIIAWVLLGSALFLRWAIGLKGKAVAYVTMVAVFLILFAMLGVGLFCGTGHVFSSLGPENIVGVVQV